MLSCTSGVLGPATLYNWVYRLQATHRAATAAAGGAFRCQLLAARAFRLHCHCRVWRHTAEWGISILSFAGAGSRRSMYFCRKVPYLMKWLFDDPICLTNTYYYTIVKNQPTFIVITLLLLFTGALFSMWHREQKVRSVLGSFAGVARNWAARYTGRSCRLSVELRTGTIAPEFI